MLTLRGRDAVGYSIEHTITAPLEEPMPPSSERDYQLVRLSEESAAKLLARAIELDAVRSAGASVTELRAAATEAGIAPEAFDQALREIHETPGGPVSPSSRGRHPIRRWRAVAAVLAVILLIALALSLSVEIPRGEPERAPVIIEISP